MSPSFTLFGEFTLLGAVHAWQHECGNKSETSLEALGDLEVMCFTGLKDKNGVDIYEGDIINDNGENMLIIWHDAYASFGIQKKGWAYTHFFGEAVQHEHCAVIGNKFQNPELLKQ